MPMQDQMTMSPLHRLHRFQVGDQLADGHF
jgi:hypothetical protein